MMHPAENSTLTTTAINDAFEVIQAPRVFAEMRVGGGAVKCTGRKTPEFSLQNDEEQVGFLKYSRHRRHCPVDRLAR